MRGYDVMREAGDGLSREVWVFDVEGPAAVGGVSDRVRVALVAYRVETRPTRRHRTWATKPGSTWRCTEPIADVRAAAMLPPDVGREVRDAVRTLVSVEIGRATNRRVPWPGLDA